MTVTRNDAQSALHDVERARRHTLTLLRYRLSSPYLVLWGALWLVAGGIGALSPDMAGIGWLVVDAVGILGTGCLITVQARRYEENPGMFRYIATIGVVAAFIAMTLMVFSPVSASQVQMLITLLVATAYMIAGCWHGTRFAIVGAVLATLAIGFFHLTPDHLPTIVPFLGGGALVFGGLWMRRAW